MEFPSCHPIYDTNTLLSLDELEVFHKDGTKRIESHTCEKKGLRDGMDMVFC